MAGNELLEMPLLCKPESCIEEPTMPNKSLVMGIPKARILMPNGIAIFRRGSIFINAAIAQGGKVIPDPLNNLPDGISEEPAIEVQTQSQEEPHQRKRGRPKGSRNAR